MKQKIYKIANITGTVILAITIIIFNLIIGGNEKSLPILPMAILMGLSIAILLIKKIIYKEKIIKSKIDVAVTLFMVTLLFPLIFKTYSSYWGSVEFILKYFFVYTMYLLTRNVVDSKRKLSILIYITIFSSLIFIILGIDIQNKNYFYFLIDKLDLKYTPNERFSSTFGYANAVSIYITFLVFLAINRIENTNKKILKVILFLYIILGTYIIYISYSRVVLIMYIIAILVYIFSKVYKKVKIDKTKIKYIIVSVIGVIAFIVMYIVITMDYSKPYNLKEENKFRRDFEANKEYDITLYIDVQNWKEYNKKAEIQIVEVNEYFKETILASDKLIPIKQMKKFKITPSEDMIHVMIKIKNKGKCDYIVNKCYINDEEYNFSYKYIPDVISRLITSFKLTDPSIVLRKQFYENSMRMWKDSPIIGHGGNAWKRLSLAYEEYYYAVKETHSYFFELLISYGIVGVIAFLGILILLCKNAIKEMKEKKETRKEKLAIFIGLMLLVIYSLTFDFSMSFIVIILAVFVFIGIMQFENKEEVNLKIVDYSVLVSILLVLAVLICSNIAKYIVKDNSERLKLAPYVKEYNYKNVDKNNIETIKSFMLKEPYFAQNEIYNNYWNCIKENYKNMNEEELIKNINFGIDRFKKIKPVSQMEFEKIFQRVNIIGNIIEILEEISNVNLQKEINELKKLMKDEYEVNLENLKDLRRNNLSKNTSESYIKKYEDIINRLEK